MAGDWIKMRADLQTHPKVVRIASALNADRLRAVGGLHAVWCLFDAHSIDGSLEGYTPETLDSLIGFKGFTRAMESVDWLAVGDNRLSLPRFDEHNGQSAKRRASDAQRKRNVRKTSAPEADKLRTREEKRREEKRGIPPTSVSPVGDGDKALLLIETVLEIAAPNAPFDEFIASGWLRNFAPRDEWWIAAAIFDRYRSMVNSEQSVSGIGSMKFFSSALKARYDEGWDAGGDARGYVEHLIAKSQRGAA